MLFFFHKVYVVGAQEYEIGMPFIFSIQLKNLSSLSCCAAVSLEQRDSVYGFLHAVPARRTKHQVATLCPLQRDAVYVA